MSKAPNPIRVERVQTGLRIEKRVLKVLKAVAEIHDLSLGDLVEGIVLHAFDGECAFGADTLAKITDLRRVYGLDLDARASHRMVDAG
jgi:predicted DNA-binding ribbon-helix-helix protein